MSDPVLLQITFMMKKDTPEDIKELILYSFTDYYTKYFPKEEPSWDKILGLYQKYPEIRNVCRNDCYHNIELQRCNLSKDDLYDFDNKRITKDIGISIVSLPRSYNMVWEFFKLMKPYIYSRVPTLGIATLDYGNDCWVYYLFGKNIYTKKIQISRSSEATLIC